MGEALLKDAIAKEPAGSPLKNLKIISAGTYGEDGMRATQYAVEVLKQRGIDFKGHIAQSISKDMLDSSFALVAMTKNHLDTVKAYFPKNLPPRALTLLSLDPNAKYKDVMDPYGYDLNTYKNVCDEIASAIPYLVEYLKRELE